jgi:hypothetical protein
MQNEKCKMQENSKEGSAQEGLTKEGSAVVS